MKRHKSKVSHRDKPDSDAADTPIAKTAGPLDDSDLRHPDDKEISGARFPKPEDTGLNDRDSDRDGIAVDFVSESAEKQIVQLQDQLLRLRADFDNYRKRTLREKSLLSDTANQELMLELLPVLDHLQLAIKAADEHDAEAAFREGLRMIFDQLMGALTKFGLEPVDAMGQAFDLNIHDAVNYLPSGTHPEGTVIDQVRRGYLLKGRLLRPAQVVVSSGAEFSSESGGAVSGKL